MTNIQPDIAPQSTSPSRFAWLRSLITPFAIFNLVLVTILITSWMVWLPSVTRIDVGGSAKSALELRTYQTQLTASILAEEEKRDALVIPMRDPLYDEVKSRKMQSSSLEELSSEIHRVASFVSKQPDSVHIETIAYRHTDRTLHLTGDVRYVGPSSMTILAAFTDQLSGLSFVDSITAPRFVREEDPTIGFHSPFDMSLMLK